MILYHGSAFTVQEPKVIASEIGKDFGFGFYTTAYLNFIDKERVWSHES